MSAMTPQRWSQIKSVFNAALERPEPERAAWLRSECGSDSGLLEAAEKLLRSHETLGGFLDEPAAVDPEDLALASPPMAGAAPEGAAWQPGDRVGEFEIVRPIGRGGMGIVYLATDQRLHRQVALKSLPAALAGDTGLRERLKREARAAATITDQAVATVFSLEEVDGQLLLASEFLDGRTLRAVIDEGPMDVAAVHAIGIQVAQGLRAAHEAGVVHRDLKPENVMITPSGAAKIVDFGIAWLEGPGYTHQTKLTRAGALVGTPAYMAPEQLMGQRVDARTDIYAFGVILSEMLSGRHPLSVDEGTPVGRERTPEDQLLARLLQRIADHCRQTAPDRRVATARELVAMFDGLSGATRAPGGATAPDRKVAVTPGRFWWEFHQGAAAVSYGALLVPAWFARIAIGGVEGRSFFIATACAAVMASMLRLHLWFTSRQHPADLSWARRRSAPWLRLADILVVVSLVIGAGLVAAPSVLDVVLLVLAVGVAVSFMLIEPSTARAAGLDSPPDRT
jgi:eukaryotic-like serine/threonine-protein kinase